MQEGVNKTQIVLPGMMGALAFSLEEVPPSQRRWIGSLHPRRCSSASKVLMFFG